MTEAIVEFGVVPGVVQLLELSRIDFGGSETRRESAFCSVFFGIFTD